MPKLTSLILTLALLVALLSATLAEDGGDTSSTATTTTTTDDSGTTTATTTTTTDDSDTTDTTTDFDSADDTSDSTTDDSTAITTTDTDTDTTSTDTDSTTATDDSESDNDSADSSDDTSPTAESTDDSADDEDTSTDDDIETIDIDEETECADFDNNHDGTIDDFEKELCRGKKILDRFRDEPHRIDCEHFDGNADGVVDDQDKSACRVHRERARYADQNADDVADQRMAEHERNLRPLILEIRWGRLDGQSEATDLQDYSGQITLTGGEGKILHPIAFEDGDSITAEEGATLSWESVVTDHFDGVLVKVKPEEPEFDAEGNITSDHSLTLTLGEFFGTLTPAEESRADFYGIHDLSDGHQIEIRNVGHLENAPRDVSDAVMERLFEDKVKIYEKLDDADRQFQGLLDDGAISGQIYDQFDGVREQISAYNFYGQGADDIQQQLVELITSAQESGLSAIEIASEIVQLQRDFAVAKQQALKAKFEAGLVPFRDVDDSEWYGSFVTYAKDNSIVSGYQGDRAGEYGPGDQVTVAEILKMALNAADHGEATSADSRHSDHWAAKFFQKAKDLGLSLGTEEGLDPNQLATRGEVANLVVEALGIIPSATTVAPFSDVSLDHFYADAIAYLKDAGVISGDSTGDTFRPDEGINRAEVAKIIQNMIEILKASL